MTLSSQHFAENSTSLAPLLRRASIKVISEMQNENNDRNLQMYAKHGRAYFTAFAATVSLTVIAEGWDAAATGVYLYGGILGPVFLVVRTLILPLRLGRILTSFHAFAATWIIACLLFFLRKLLPSNAPIFDLTIFGAAWFGCLCLPKKSLISFSTDAFQAFGKIFHSRWDHLYCFFLLPILFFLIRLGNEVIAGDQVLYYGLLYIDFGVLKGITSLLVASDFLPEELVHGTGPLSYHWLFFAVPAWHSDLFGRGHDMNGVLSLANYLAAVFFYKTFSHLIAILTRQIAHVKNGAWAGPGAIIAIFGLNIRYFHETAFSITGWGLIDPGIRNRLILSFPNSLNAFGYNTFALGLLVIAVISLHYWNRTGNRRHLYFASFWVACLPIFSATIGPGVAGGIGAACLLKQVRSPWYSLASFAAFGAATMIIFNSLGVFASRDEPPKITFDGGQFLINCLLASPVFLVVAFWGKRGWCVPLYMTCLCIGLGAVAFPSTILLGNTSTPSDISMKNYSAIATMLGAAAVSVFPLVAGKQTSSIFRTRLYTVVGVVLISLGFANSLAYAMSSVFMRFPQIAPSISRIRYPNYISLPLNYFQSLEYVREVSDRSAVIVAKPFPLTRDPAIIVSGRRSLLPTDFFVKHTPDVSVNSDLKDRLVRWSQWEQSGFADESLAKWFSERADILVIEGESPSEHWRPIKQFNIWRVYERANEGSSAKNESGTRSQISRDRLH